MKRPRVFARRGNMADYEEARHEQEADYEDEDE
jgi:hypothetical protein